MFALRIHRESVVGLACTRRALVSGILTLLLLAATGCRTTAAKHDAAFSVVTYNVFVDRPDFDAVEHIVRDADADVVFLQETTARWTKTLKDMGRRYPYQHGELDTHGMGNVLLSRLPIVRVQRLPARYGWHGAWFAVVSTPIGPVQILGVHLTPPLTDDSHFTVGAFLETGPAHRQEIEDFCAAIDFDAPLVVLGDFNEDESGAAASWLRQHGLRSALDQFDLISPTWAWVGTPLVTARLDHVFYSNRLQPRFAKIFPAGKSDHHPVLAAFDTAPPEPAPIRPRPREPAPQTVPDRPWMLRASVQGLLLPPRPEFGGIRSAGGFE